MTDLHRCSCSEESFAYNSGIKGEDAEKSGILFVLHRSDSRALPDDWTEIEEKLEHAFETEDDNMLQDIEEYLKQSYFEALKESQTGRLLGWLFEHCGIGYDDVYVTNMYKCLLPDDRNPRKAEYLRGVSHLERQVSEEFPAQKIVVFGSKPFEILWPEEAKGRSCGDAVGSVFDYHGVPALLCYHPRWIWSMSPEEREQEYERIKEFLES